MKFLFTSEPPKVETGTDDILYNNYCLAVKLSKIETSKAVVKNPETKSQRTVKVGSAYLEFSIIWAQTYCQTVLLVNGKTTNLLSDRFSPLELRSHTQ